MANFFDVILSMPSVEKPSKHLAEELPHESPYLLPSMRLSKEHRTMSVCTLLLVEEKILTAAVFPNKQERSLEWDATRIDTIFTSYLIQTAVIVNI